jgi:hypothetical protein
MPPTVRMFFAAKIHSILKNLANLCVSLSRTSTGTVAYRTVVLPWYYCRLPVGYYVLCCCRKSEEGERTEPQAREHATHTRSGSYLFITTVVSEWATHCSLHTENSHGLQNSACAVLSRLLTVVCRMLRNTRTIVDSTAIGGDKTHSRPPSSQRQHHHLVS